WAYRFTDNRSSSSEPMSALGQKQTSRHLQPMSALPPKADIGTQPRNVRFVPKADIANDRRTLIAAHQLMTRIDYPREPEDNLREDNAEADSDPLQRHEIDRGAEDRRHGDLRRRNALEIEQRIAEWRREKRHLHVDHENDAVPQRHILGPHAGSAKYAGPG